MTFTGLEKRYRNAYAQSDRDRRELQWVVRNPDHDVLVVHNLILIFACAEIENSQFYNGTLGKELYHGR